MDQRLPLHDQTGHVRYYHHIASSVVCKSLTLTLEGCRRGWYSVPSTRMGTLGSCLGDNEHKGPMLIYVCFVLYDFLMFKHWLCWKYQYNIYMFNFIYIYSFIHMSGCVGIGPSALLFPGARDAAKRPCCYCYYPKSSRGSTHVKCYGNVVA